MNNRITLETRRESNLKVNKMQWYYWITNILSDGIPRTAREVAIEIANKRNNVNYERQCTAPRICELKQKGIIEVVDKVKDHYTGRTVARFTLKENNDENN